MDIWHSAFIMIVVTTFAFSHLVWVVRAPQSSRFTVSLGAAAFMMSFLVTLSTFVVEIINSRG